MCQQIIKKIEAFLKKDIIRSLVICSIIFALFIHILFKIKTGPEYLKAEWEAGDILTYVSTVALGLLALWQNKRFKEENDISQARLEKLTEQANEQTIINKIIEIESGKLSETKKAISIFSDICDPVLNFPNMFAGQLNSEQELHERFYMCAIQKRKIDESFSELFRTLNVDSNTENRFAHRFLADATKYKNAVEIAIQQISRMSHDVEAMISDKELESLHTIRNEFDESRNDFICHREELLRKIIFDNLSMDEIKDLIKDEYASYKELVED